MAANLTNAILFPHSTNALSCFRQFGSVAMLDNWRQIVFKFHCNQLFRKDIFYNFCLPQLVV